jgi:hypothetical protein
MFECNNDVGNLCTPENLFGWVKGTMKDQQHQHQQEQPNTADQELCEVRQKASDTYKAKTEQEKKDEEAKQKEVEQAAQEDRSKLEEIKRLQRERLEEEARKAVRASPISEGVLTYYEMKDRGFKDGNFVEGINSLKDLRDLDDPALEQVVFNRLLQSFDLHNTGVDFTYR